MSTINVTTEDFTRISSRLLDDNWIIGVGFLDGYVFLRTLIHEDTPYYYDPNVEIASTNLLGILARTFIAAQKFGSTALNTPNVFAVTDNFNFYQFFWGVSPSATRVFTTVGATQENNLDVGNVGTTNDYRFGYIDGTRSPLASPAPETESWVTKGMDYLWAVFNPLQTQISPVWRFYIRRFKIGVIRDPALIGRILAGQPVNPGASPARLRVIGGLNPPAYNMAEAWRVKPLRLDAKPEDISAAIIP